MIDRTPKQDSIATIEVGIVVLAATVSAVVWYRMFIWLWDICARQGWWSSPGDGARVIAGILALVATRLIWGRVDYWLHPPERMVSDNPSPEAEGNRP